MEKPRKGSKAGVPPVHEKSFKILVAREYQTGKLSYGQLARKYGLSGEHTPRYFVKWYREWLRDRGLRDDQQVPQEVEKANQDLEKRLFEANLKITALEMLIQKAEENLGIDIGKKSGTKSSNR